MAGGLIILKVTTRFKNREEMVSARFILTDSVTVTKVSIYSEAQSPKT